MNTNLLIIYIRNSRDIYALTEWLQNALLKKVNRGLTPSVEYLANCSTMKKIVRMAAKMLSDQDHKTATKQEKEQAAKETAINYLRITETEYNLLYQAEDKQYFKYLLYTLGIVERWKRESNEALKKLEELTGQTWENPYKPENERFTLKLTDEERTTITNRINDGYYRPEAVQARKDEEKRKAYEKKRAEIINNCEKKQEKAENEKRVMLAVLDAGLSVSNVIYYDHSNELVFNWRDHETKITENDFNKFVSSVNRSLLPVGITFKMK